MVMTALDRKLVRGLARLWSQAAAIAAVIAAGVAVSVLGLCNLQTLTRSRDDFYERARFADVFVSLKRAPLAFVNRLEAERGVEVVEPRVTGHVLLDMPALDEPVTARMIGLAPPAHPLLNDVVVTKGRYLEAGAPGEVLVSEPFAGAHRLQPGDALTAVINERRRRLTIVGIALSPEFVYAIRPGTLFPDDLRFGVLWADRAELAGAFGLTGAFNDALVRLEPGASALDVAARLDRIIGPYGGAGAYDRSDQVSHWYLEGELAELRATSRILPFIFSAVAAFLLHIVVSRLVATEREQIGLLKAFGYRSATIALHYVKLVLLITAAGVAGGVLLGIWLGRMLIGIYGEFFHFPALLFEVPASAVGGAALVVSLVTVVGSLLAVNRILRLAPVAAMRPPAPARFRRTIAERMGIGRMIAPSMQFVLRNLERRSGRALLSLLAVSLAVAIMLLGRFSDALMFLVETEFRIAQRQDATVTFVEPRQGSVVAELRHYPGVLYVEPFRVVGVTFRHGARSHRGAVNGIPARPLLSVPLDDRRRPRTIPDEGLVLSEKLARLLGVRPGDPLVLEVREGARPIRTAVVAATVRDYIGTSAYMERSALNRLMREGSQVSGAHLALDPRREAETLRRIKATPGVAGLFLTRALRQSVLDTLAESMSISLAFLVALAAVIAFGVVYNSTRIMLSERAWELATLRVLGFRRDEVALLLLGEVALIVALAIPLGLVIGYWQAHLVSAAFDTEQYRIPPVFERSSYVFAGAVVVAAAVASGAVVWRLIRHLDLIAVLKARE